MCYSKLSSLLNSPSHDVRAFFRCSTKSGCKISANRTKYQIYLSISEMPPNFCDEVTKDSASRAKALLAFLLGDSPQISFSNRNVGGSRVFAVDNPEL